MYDESTRGRGAPMTDAVMNAEPGDRVGARSTQQWYRGTVEEVQEDPEPFGAEQVVRRLVVGSGPKYKDYTFYIELLASQRLRVVKGGRSSTVIDTEGPE